MALIGYLDIGPKQRKEGGGDLASTGYLDIGPVQRQESANTAITPSVGSLILTGIAPTIAVSANQSITPASGVLLLTGQAPTISTGATQTITPGSGALLLTGQSPTLAQTANVIFTPLPGALLLTGQAPSFLIEGSSVITANTGAILLAGQIPAVTVSGEQFGRSGLGGDDIPYRRNPNRGWDREEYQRRRKKEAQLEETIKGAYQELMGADVPETVQAQVQKIVKPTAVKTTKGPELVIDWEAIARSYERTNALIKLQQEEAELRAIADDDEEVMLLAAHEFAFRRRNARL